MPKNKPPRPRSGIAKLLRNPDTPFHKRIEKTKRELLDKMLKKEDQERMEKEAVMPKVSDMEAAENLLGLKGRFVGDMVQISVKDLAEISRRILDWQPLETAPQDGTELIFWVSSEKGFPDITANFFYMMDTKVSRSVYGDAVGCWYWQESEEPLKRPDLVKGWKFYPQVPKVEG